MGYFDIVLQTRASLHPDGEPTDFIATYTGSIQYTRDQDGKTFRVGKVRAYRIHVDLAWGNDVSLFEICDAHSAEMDRICAALFDVEEDDLKLRIRSQFDCIDSDVLVLDYVLLHPRWRGLKLGLLAARTMIDLLSGGCGLVVSHIHPLNPDATEFRGLPEAWIPRQSNPEEVKEARNKLRRYFKRMGFERIVGTRFHGLSLARKTPTLSDLLRPRKENPAEPPACGGTAGPEPSCP